MRPGQRHNREARRALDRLKRERVAQAQQVIEQAKAELTSACVDVQLRLYTTHNRSGGRDAVDLLATLGWLIGAAASVQINVSTDRQTDAQLKRLHGALRTVHAMCLAGYRWQADHAPLLDAAIDEAHAVLWAHPHLLKQVEKEAAYYSDRIRAKVVEPADVAGAEIYREEPIT